MATITFDTLKFVEKLKAGGVPEAQAKVEAEALAEVFADAMENQLASKTDIVRLENILQNHTARLENRLETIELRLTLKMGGMLVIAVGVIAALARL